MGFVFALAGLNGAAAGAKGSLPVQQSSRLQICGSRTMGPMLREIAAKYRLLHPEVSIEVELGGSLRGLDALRAGEAQIAMLSRALAPGEHDLYGIPIARDGVGLVVHVNNPVQELAVSQLQDVFSGRVRDWNDLGGAYTSIHSVGALPGSASNTVLARFLKQDMVTFQLSAAVESDTQRLAVIAACENGIGFVSVGAAERAIAQGAPIRLLPISGIAASMANIRNGSYPICRALTLASKEPPVDLARSFFVFCLSAQVKAILASYDFVPYLD